VSGFAQQLCCILCGSYGPSVYDFWKNAPQADRDNLRVNSSYDMSLNKDFIYGNAEYKLQCSGTPSIILSPGKCSAVGTSVDPVSYLEGICGANIKDGLVPAKYQMTITFTTDAPAAELKSYLDSVLTPLSTASAWTAISVSSTVSSTAGKVAYTLTVGGKNYQAFGILNYIFITSDNSGNGLSYFIPPGYTLTDSQISGITTLEGPVAPPVTDGPAPIPTPGGNDAHFARVSTVVSILALVVAVFVL